MSCKDCITMKKCCGEFFADGACCGGGEQVIIPCPEHAVADTLRPAQLSQTALQTAKGSKLHTTLDVVGINGCKATQEIVQYGGAA